MVTLLLHLAIFQGIAGFERAPRFRIERVRALTGADFLLADLNNRGQFTGSYYDSTGMKSFIYNSQKLTIIPPLPGCTHMMAQAINDKGVAVGYGIYRRSPGEDIAFIFEGGKTRPLEANDQLSSYAHSIANSGLIVGFMQTKGAVIWKNGRRQELPGPKEDTFAYGTNENGDITGTSGNKPIVWHAVAGQREMWHSFERQLKKEFPTLAGFPLNRIFDTNKSQVSVGQCTGNNPDRSRAALWIHYKVYDMNSLVQPDKYWLLEKAYCINDKGTVLGSGLYKGKKTPFLLQPTPSGFRR